MRIIDKRRDYYDGVQGMGFDPTLVYLRREEEVFVDRKKWPFPTFAGRYNKHYACHYMIGFCGKVYPVIELTRGGPYGSSISTFCYNMDEVDAFMKARLDSNELAYYNDKAKRLRSLSRRWWRADVTKRKQYELFFKACAEVKDKFRRMFEDKLCPIFVAYPSGRYEDGKIDYNALLKPFGFMRIFDPYTAFQEISMFMGGMAMPEKEMPEIPDVIKAESKGFNKWSFRTPPAGL